MEKSKYVLSNERGSLGTEQIVWIAVILLIAVGAFLYKDKILAFFSRAGERIDSLTNEISH